MAQRTQPSTPASPPKQEVPVIQANTSVFKPFTPEAASFGGFIFDPSKFPFTLLEKLQAIAVKMSSLKKTGGKKKDSTLKYDYFEEAELVKHLVVYLAEAKIGYAAGAYAITNRFVVGTTHSGNQISNVQVRTSVIFSDKASGEWIIIPGVGEAMDSGDKACTKGITSSDKYILMKTFMISDGQEIELEQGQGEHPPQQGKSQSKSQTPAATQAVKCRGCGKVVGDVENNGKKIPAATIVAKAVEKFGVPLCAGCAMKRSDKNPATKQEPPRKAAANGSPDEPFATTLRKATSRQVTSKGKKVTVFDLVLDGVEGLVTDFHTSHHEYYKDIPKSGVPVEIVYSEKQNGKWMNRNILALMRFNDELIENENGDKLENDPQDYSQAEADSDPEDRQDDMDFGLTDDDIPF